MRDDLNKIPSGRKWRCGILAAFVAGAAVVGAAASAEAGEGPRQEASPPSLRPRPTS